MWWSGVFWLVMDECLAGVCTQTVISPPAGRVLVLDALRSLCASFFFLQVQVSGRQLQGVTHLFPMCTHQRTVLKRPDLQPPNTGPKKLCVNSAIVFPKCQWTPLTCMLRSWTCFLCKPPLDFHIPASTFHPVSSSTKKSKLKNIRSVLFLRPCPHVAGFL